MTLLFIRIFFLVLSGVVGFLIGNVYNRELFGVLVALAEKFALPVFAIGVGEGVDDLRPFDANAYARGLVGLE